MSLVEVFARNLKAARTRKKLSQTNLAARAGVTVSYVSMLERAQRSPPLETVEHFGRALGVPPVSLLQR